jgi:(S)-mandelate dehydrogenase
MKPHDAGVEPARLRRAATIGDLRELARRELARMVFDYIDGAAGEEHTASRNREALQRVRLLPEVLLDVSSRSLACTLFGERQAMPVVVGPTGLNGAAWPRGDLCLARAAAAAGVPFVMSTAATSGLTEVASAAGPLRWFQLYMLRDRGLAREFLHRVRESGFRVLELTVDTPVGGRRPRDIRNGFTLPFRWSVTNLLDAARHWRWAARMLRQGTPELKVFAEILGSAARGDTISEVMQQQLSGSFTWDEVAWLREHWTGPLLLKGLWSPEHARRARALGIDGAVVSNHGGRQLDGAGATIEALPGFVEAARGELTVLVDSGFRSGTDIAKAIALGADGVQLGRATLYGLAAGGTHGARRALSILAQELDLAMALCGARDIGELRGRCVAHEGPRR